MYTIKKIIKKKVFKDNKKYNLKKIKYTSCFEKNNTLVNNAPVV